MASSIQLLTIGFILFSLSFQRFVLFIHPQTSDYILTYQANSFNYGCFLRHSVYYQFLDRNSDLIFKVKIHQDGIMIPLLKDVYPSANVLENGIKIGEVKANSVDRVVTSEKVLETFPACEVITSRGKTAIILLKWLTKGMKDYLGNELKYLTDPEYKIQGRIVL